jgi:DNA-binding LytR/AlgR family response regulator
MLNCLIVEDEPLAADILVDYVKQMPSLKLKGTCGDAILALDVMQRELIDLVFLDIHLPGLKGLDFLKTLKNPPAVILTTAYHQYAVEGYELNVVDYLLKPIEFKRFVEAVNKVPARQARDTRQTIAIQAEKKTMIVPLDEIIYIESQKEYIKIVTTTSSYTTKYSLTKMEEELDPGQFLRVHRSFIVAIPKIKAFSGHDVDLVGKTIPIGGNYRETVGSRLRGIFK